MSGSDRTTLGDRMKLFERTTRQVLDRDQYAVVRVDGRAFHSYLRNSPRPFDLTFMEDMDAVGVALCQEISGAVLGYVQSDEVSIVISTVRPHVGRTGERTFIHPWFGGQVQKIVSVTASIATATLLQRRPGPALPLFDSRVFNMGTDADVRDYLIWRGRDAVRNSVSMAAQARFDHRDLLGVSTDAMLVMLEEAGEPWESQPAGARYGRVIERVTYPGSATYTRKDTGVTHTIEVERHRWQARPAPPFGHHPDGYLSELIQPLPEWQES